VPARRPGAVRVRGRCHLSWSTPPPSVLPLRPMGGGHPARGHRRGPGHGGLYLDMPIGCTRRASTRGGSPSPSPRPCAGRPARFLLRGGPGLGIPAAAPDRIRSSEYRYVIAMLRHAFSRADALRIDHVMGLHACTGFPASSTLGMAPTSLPRRGAARRGGHRGRQEGRSGDRRGPRTVDEAVRADMTADGMLRSWVFQFEASAEDPLPAEPERAMASFGTHDLPASPHSGTASTSTNGRVVVWSTPRTRRASTKGAPRCARPCSSRWPTVRPTATAPPRPHRRQQHRPRSSACCVRASSTWPRAMPASCWSPRGPLGGATPAEPAGHRSRGVELAPPQREVTGRDRVRPVRRRGPRGVGERRRRHASHQPGWSSGKSPASGARSGGAQR